MILAAGRGERMRPLTDNCPKPLLEVAGRPLIEHHLEKLAAAGVTQVVINHAYLGAMIEARLGDGSRWNVSIHYSPEPQALETAGGIIEAIPLLGDEPFWVLNGDIWTDWDYKALFARELEAGALGHLTFVENPPQHPQGDFGLCDGWVSANPCWTFSGVALYDPRLFEGLTPGRRPLLPLFQEAIAAQQLTGHVQPGYWCDVGTPERLNALDLKLAN
jgi:MurNAc alpha-1-phosphate uridylyltransferase